MANIVTPDFRARNAISFVSDITSGPNSNVYYTFVSSMDETDTFNSEYSKREFLENTLFGKKVLPSDIFYMVKNNKYEKGRVYDAYDDRADLTNKNFFVTVYPTDEDTGNYYVFKCLGNNYGATANDDISYSGNTPDQLYNTTADGYIWKYLYTISNAQFRSLSTNGLIPIIEDTEASAETVDGIESILITNPGGSYGYRSFSGTVTDRDVASGGQITTIFIQGTNLSPVEGYYVGQTISITKPAGGFAGTRLYTIARSELNEAGKYEIGIEETVTNLEFIDNTCTFLITPRIEIIGNGSGATAIPIIDPRAGEITSIRVIDIGQGYTNASARVVDPLYGFETTGLNVTGSRCLIRPIISPNQGHNKNLREELLCRHVLINTEINVNDNVVIPTSRTYSKIGLVKNPQFTTDYVLANTAVFDNRLKLSLDTSEGIDADDILYQYDNSPIPKITFQGKVHSIDGDDVYLTNYMGPFLNTTDLSQDTTLSFDEEKTLKNDNGVPFNILSAVTSDYRQRTGEVFYINTFEPITRTIDSLEQYKILLQF